MMLRQSLRTAGVAARPVHTQMAYSLALRSIHTSRIALQKEEADDRMIGPYPKLPFEYYNHRPQDIKYDDQQGRRNFGEPLHHQFDLIDVWSPDHFDQRTDATATRWNLYFFGLVGLFSAVCWYNWKDPEFVRRYYPYDGLNKALGGEPDTKDMFAARSKPE